MATMFELRPQNGRKSFYGKAVCVRQDNGDIVLYSYGVPVAVVTAAGNYSDIPADMGGSRTSKIHKKSFKIFMGVY